MKVKQMTDEFPRRLQYRESSAGYHSETLDTKPLVVPFDCKKPETLEHAIARIMQIKEAKQLDDEWETEDEAEDFDCEHEDDLRSRYELFEDDYFSVQKEPEPKSESEPKKTAKKSKKAAAAEDLDDTPDDAE